MFQLVLGLLIWGFGIFLKVTKNPGFRKSKKFSWMFIAIGILSILGKLLLLYQTGEL